MADEKAASRSKRRKKQAGRKRKGAYVATLATTPTQKMAQMAEWFWWWFLPPNFHVIIIANGNVHSSTWTTHASRGFLRTSADWVCWVNRDSDPHLIQFVGNPAPFDVPLVGNKLTVPGSSPTAWYRISRGSGTGMQSVKYNYFVDVPPGPDGPSVISEG